MYNYHQIARVVVAIVTLGVMLPCNHAHAQWDSDTADALHGMQLEHEMERMDDDRERRANRFCRLNSRNEKNYNVCMMIQGF
jgi:hypothetical protein